MPRHTMHASLIAMLMMAAPLWALPVGPNDTGGAVESALADYNLYAAGIALNAVTEARLPKTAGHPDPVLDRLFVDYLSARGFNPVAVAILQRLVADPATPNRAHYRLLLATYAEETGALVDAEQGYRALISDAKTGADDRLSASLGLARVQMIADPAAALATLGGIDPHTIPAVNAWEVDLLTARAASMTAPVDTAKVTSLLDRAWSEAPLASLVDVATSRVAGDRALFAGRTGDRKTLVAMLAIDRYNRNPNAGQYAVAADLPICGTAGVTPQDRVEISVVRQPAPGRPTVSLAWASRPGIAAPFLTAANRSGALSVSDGNSATFELACRTAPSPDYAVRLTADIAATAWMTSQGAYPLYVSADELSPAAAGSLLAQREARYGSTSAMLLPVLFNILPTEIAGMSDDTARKQAADTMARIGAILVANHAPADLILFWQMSSAGVAVMAQTKTPTEAQTEFEALLAKAATDPNISIDTLYMLASGSAQSPALPNSFKTATLASTIDLLQRKAPAGDQRTAALALRLYALRQSQGDSAGALAAIKPLGLASNLCILSDPPTHIVSSNITSNDYPGDLVFTSLQGITRVEFSLDAAGNAKDGRIIFSDPPDAFDAITLSRVSTIHYEPARIGGSAVACRAVDQNVRWQLPY